jgi:hypothetical protein
MNPRLVEFALKKQRLQIHADMQRADMMRRLEGIEPVLDVADRVRAGLHWTREHIPVIASTAVVLLLIKPRLTFRVARRVWLGWLLLRRMRRTARPLIGVLDRVRELVPRR